MVLAMLLPADLPIWALKIVFCDIKQEFVDKGLAAYSADGIDAKGYVCDVTDEAAVQEMVKKIEAEVGVIDILVNNAGIIERIPMCDMTAEEFRQVIDVDLNAPFIVSKAVIPSMIKKGAGKIINICSMMSELGREKLYQLMLLLRADLRCLPETFVQSTASTISSVMVLGPDILLHLRLLRLERSSRTVQDIRLTNSLSLRRLLLVGEILKTFRDLPLSWLVKLQILLTDIFFMLTAVSWLTSANSRKPKFEYFLRDVYRLSFFMYGNISFENKDC